MQPTKISFNNSICNSCCFYNMKVQGQLYRRIGHSSINLWIILYFPALNKTENQNQEKKIGYERQTHRIDWLQYIFLIETKWISTEKNENIFISNRLYTNNTQRSLCLGVRRRYLHLLNDIINLVLNLPHILIVQTFQHTHRVFQLRIFHSTQKW